MKDLISLARTSLQKSGFYRAEIVLADVWIVWTDKTTQPDLLWVLRGCESPEKRLAWRSANSTEYRWLMRLVQSGQHEPDQAQRVRGREDSGGTGYVHSKRDQHAEPIAEAHDCALTSPGPKRPRMSRRVPLVSIIPPPSSFSSLATASDFSAIPSSHYEVGQRRSQEVPRALTRPLGCGAQGDPGDRTMTDFNQSLTLELSVRRHNRVEVHS